MKNLSKLSAKWYVYILYCNDRTLYTGITNNIERRIREHNHETCGARYTSSRRPVKLVYYEAANSRSSASKREYQVRTLSRHKKKDLIFAFYSNPDAKDKGIKLSMSAIKKLRDS